MEGGRSRDLGNSSSPCAKAESRVTAQLMTMRNEVREVHEKLLMKLQVEEAARVDEDLKRSVEAFTKEIDERKEKACEMVMGLFQRKIREMGTETYSGILKCFQPFDENLLQKYENGEDQRVLSDDDKLLNTARNFLDIVNRFYCHNIDIFNEIPNSALDFNLEADARTNGQLMWSREMVKAEKEWEEHGARLISLGQHQHKKEENFHENLIKYVDGQLELALTLVCIQLKSSIKRIVADAKAQSRKIEVYVSNNRLKILTNKWNQDAALFELDKIKENVDKIVTQIENSSYANISDIQTAAYIQNQARQEASTFERILREACHLYIANVVMSAKVCLLREIEKRSDNCGLSQKLRQLLDEIK